MHPVLSSARALAWYVGLWGLAGLALAAALVVGNFGGWINALGFAVPLAIGFGFLAPSAYYVCRTLPVLQRRWTQTVVRFVVATVLVASLTWAGAVGWNQLGLAWGVDGLGLNIAPGLSAALWLGSAGLYLGSLLLHSLMIASDDMRQAQQRELQSRALARDAELALFRAQINPHFLFNALNSISALTSLDPAGARRMTIALAQYFRKTLALPEQGSIPLAQELAHCQCFLDIEAQRFGSKLGVDVQVTETAALALVPPMLLQPLVENAVKHGVARSMQGGTIGLRAQVIGAWLHITIDNPQEPDGSAVPSSSNAPQPVTGLGLGLRATEQRLLGQYGNQARLAYHPTHDATGSRFVVELTLPCSFAAPSAHST